MALNFGTIVPAHAVMAALKRCAASDKVYDGIASSLSTTDIANFGAKLKDAFI